MLSGWEELEPREIAQVLAQPIGGRDAPSPRPPAPSSDHEQKSSNGWRERSGGDRMIDMQGHCGLRIPCVLRGAADREAVGPT